jgi:hypothetical protein
MEQHDVEIEIRTDGSVKVHIKGVRGKQCVRYVDLFREVVGPVREQQYTHEYYEPDGEVRVDARAQQQLRQTNPDG